MGPTRRWLAAKSAIPFSAHEPGARTGGKHPAHVGFPSTQARPRSKASDGPRQKSPGVPPGRGAALQPWQKAATSPALALPNPDLFAPGRFSSVAKRCFRVGRAGNRPQPDAMSESSLVNPPTPHEGLAHCPGERVLLPRHSAWGCRFLARKFSLSREVPALLLRGFTSVVPTHLLQGGFAHREPSFTAFCSQVRIYFPPLGRKIQTGWQLPILASDI